MHGQRAVVVRGGEPVTLWSGTYEGKLPRVNEWHGAKMVAGHARIFESRIYRQRKEDLAVSLPKPPVPISQPVDLIVEVWLWKQTDTDAPIKGVMDALEMAGIVENDRLIRDITIARADHPRSEPDKLKVTLVAATL